MRISRTRDSVAREAVPDPPGRRLNARRCSMHVGAGDDDSGARTRPAASNAAEVGDGREDA